MSSDEQHRASADPAGRRAATSSRASARAPASQDGAAEMVAAARDGAPLVPPDGDVDARLVHAERAITQLRILLGALVEAADGHVHVTSQQLRDPHARAVRIQDGPDGVHLTTPRERPVLDPDTASRDAADQGEPDQVGGAPASGQPGTRESHLPGAGADLAPIAQTPLMRRLRRMVIEHTSEDPDHVLAPNAGSDPPPDQDHTVAPEESPRPS